MIIVQLNGGLGNQMFQYACGRSLAYRYQTELVFDLSRLHKRQGGITIRSYGLDIFDIKSKEISEANLTKSKKLIFRILNTLSISLMGEGIQTSSYFIERNFSYNETIEKTSNNCFLSGYWQSPRYFQSIENLIRNDFIFPNKLNRENSNWLNKIINSNSISLHIRRTDFVDNIFHDIHGFCSLNYYRDAIKIIRSKIGEAYFFVFSDDTEWAKHNLIGESKFFFISGNMGDNSYIDMQLMRFCKHNIIANSTFSWWGAWLNDNPQKIVIAPKNWFSKKGLNDQTNDLIPDSWIRI